MARTLPWPAESEVAYGYYSLCKVPAFPAIWSRELLTIVAN